MVSSACVRRFRANIFAQGEYIRDRPRVSSGESLWEWPEGLAPRETADRDRLRHGDSSRVRGVHRNVRANSAMFRTPGLKPRSYILV